MMQYELIKNIRCFRISHEVSSVLQGCSLQHELQLLISDRLGGIQTHTSDF